MLELLQKRIATGDKSTIGAMYHGERIGQFLWGSLKFLCFTMEDQPNEPKVPGETRIPAGRYQIKLRSEGGMHGRYSAKFPWHQGMLWLQDVPDFTFVYIHYGNYEKDTDGCILIGDGAQSNVLDDGMVMSSVAAYTRLYDLLIGELTRENGEVYISVEDYA